MKEIESILQTYDNYKQLGQRMAIAIVVKVEGSSYRRMGARLLVGENGFWTGGISGGCLEGDALKRANKAIISGHPSIVTYDTMQDDEHQIGVGLGCNGIIDVLFIPINWQTAFHPIPVLQHYLSNREPKLVVTITRSADTALPMGSTLEYDPVSGSLHLPENIDPPLRNLLQHHATIQWSAARSAHIEWKDMAALFEWLPPTIHLVIFGGNYDIYPMIGLAKEMGWKVSLVANLQKVLLEKVKSVDKLFHNREGELPVIDQYSAVLLMAHDFKTDKKNLQYVWSTKTPYIGMLGPLKRAQKTLEELRNEGFEPDSSMLDRLYAPAGLDIGADTPEEIALSILSEIKAAFSGKPGTPLRLKTEPIHDRI